MPKLSIITINRNNAAGLEATLASVWHRQPSFTDFEHIVIDGASTDDSAAVIGRYASRLAYHVSEPDKGIYNAMNKGIGHAHGEYLLFLNSGDTLTDDVLARIFATGAEEDILYADLQVVSDGEPYYIEVYPDQPTLSFMLEKSLAHPASYIRRTLFDRGLYDESLRICSDWTFFMDRIVMEGATTRHIPVVAANFDASGISSNPATHDILTAERQAYIDRHFPRSVLTLANEYNRMLDTMDKISDRRTDQLLSSSWLQRKARRCIKILFRIDRLIHPHNKQQ